MKKDLLSIQGDKSLQYDNVLEKHLVSIYGKPQTGKTTLILSMLGFKDAISLDEVYETLRGGVRMGNSSTSTAIIYSKSPDDRYGISLSTIDGKILSDIEYVRKVEMMQKIKEIRTKVETNKMDTSEIIRIMIPKNYFQPNEITDQIAILDLPGVNSSNMKERPHVEALMSKLIPISSVCIILWESCDIQGLEKLLMPTGINWKNLPNRFMVVVSHAFNDDNTRKYFRIEKDKREESFYTYVNRIYKKKIGDILGPGNRTEVFPIEVGQSLSTLCTDFLKHNYDRKEIYDTMNMVLDDLRKSIVNHKGQRLSSALGDLRSLVEKFDKHIIEQCEEDIVIYNGRIKTSQAKIHNAKEKIKTIQGIKEEEEIYNNSLNELSSKLKSLVNEQEIVKQYYSNVTKYIKDCIRDSKLSIDGFKQTFVDVIHIDGTKEYIIRDGEDKYVLSAIKAGASRIINAIKNNEILQNEAFRAVQDIQDIKNPSYRLFNDIDLILLPRLYPKRGIVKSFFDYKISTTTIKYVCEIVSKRLCKDLEASIIKPAEKRLSELITKSCDKQDALVRLYKGCEKIITKEENNIKLNEKKIKYCCDEQTATRSRQKKDIKILHSFLDYTSKAYKRQKEEILSTINQAETTADDKMRLLLLLGLIEKDYESIKIGNYGQAD